MIANAIAKITRQTDGEPDIDPETGEPIPGTGTQTTSVFEGKADYQDGLSERERAQSGDTDIDATGTLFLPEGADVLDVEEGDQVEVSRQNDGRVIGSGTVQGRRLLDNKLFIKLQ